MTDTYTYRAVSGTWIISTTYGRWPETRAGMATLARILVEVCADLPVGSARMVLVSGPDCDRKYGVRKLSESPFYKQPLGKPPSVG